MDNFNRGQPGDKSPGYFQVSLRRPLRKSLFLQSVILSGARRKVLLPKMGGPERSRRTSSLLQGMTETDSSRSRQSRPAVLSQQYLSALRTSAFRQPGSFDSGSATSFGQTHLPLAFPLRLRSGRGLLPRLGKDDGAFFARGNFRRGLLRDRPRPVQNKLRFGQ